MPFRVGSLRWRAVHSHVETRELVGTVSAHSSGNKKAQSVTFLQRGGVDFFSKTPKIVTFHQRGGLTYHGKSLTPLRYGPRGGGKYSAALQSNSAGQGVRSSAETIKHVRPMLKHYGVLWIAR